MVAGESEVDGLSVDLYKDKTKKRLIFMEHGIFASDAKACIKLGILRMQEMKLI